MRRQLTIKEGLIDFASNDFLGLAHCPKLKNEMIKNWKDDQIGSTGSRLLTGNHSLTEELETWLAHFYQGEAALLFNSGYTANLGLLSAILQPGDFVAHDACIHASTIDGIRLSRVKRFSFRHQDLDDLQKKLHLSQSGKNRYVCVESVYSTDGSLAPLKEIAQLCKRYAAHLIVDEAHTTGIFGEKGKGLVVDSGINVFAKIHTFSKALGIQGAVIIGKQQLKDHLINCCRPFIYTTALPCPILVGIKVAHMAMEAADDKRNHLRSLVSRYQSFHSTSSQTPIQTIIIPGEMAAVAFSKKLQNAGFDVRALRAPTVAKGKERLRICLHAFNTIEQITQLSRILCAELSSLA